MSDVQY